MLNIIAVVLLITVSAAATWLVVLRIPRAVLGEVTAASGKVYRYRMGNNVWAGQYGNFNGIEIEIGKVLPHMYLDNVADSPGRGPKVMYRNSQQLHLEGGFDKFFQLFVPSGAQTLALSILTPDVMEVLMQTQKQYDVEIRGDKLRVSTPSRISLRAEDAEQVLGVSKKIVDELDHKLRSWTPADERAAASMVLASDDEQAIRIAGNYIGIGQLMSLTMVVIGLALFTISLTIARSDPVLKDMLQLLAGIFLLFGPAMYGYARLLRSK